MSSEEVQNSLVQNLLITGAGIVIGGVIMAASAKLQEEPEEEAGEQEEPSPRQKEGALKPPKRVRSRITLVNEEQVLSAAKAGGLPRNLSSGQLTRQMSIKKGGLKSSPSAQQMPQYGANYKTLLRRQTSKLGVELLEQAKPIIDQPLHLIDLIEYDPDDPPCFYESPLLGDNVEKGILGGSRFLPVDSFMADEAFVVASKDHRTIKDVASSLKFLKAGPRKDIFFNPDEVKAAIVTCGGLCPGLNVVIREITMSLWYNYEVRTIYGIKWGYKGFYTDVEENWIKLRPKEVASIHKLGGTILGSSRGGFDGEKIIAQLLEKGVSQVYIIGGDGTHRGIHALCELAEEKGVKIAFAGVPKTIDNDIPLIDSSFGFATSCEVAAEQIQAAYIEATGVINGVGLIKLMGRDSGFIAMKASLAHQGVDFCLVPENPYELNGPNGLYAQVYQKVKTQGYAVVVVAEGAETGLINPAERFTKDADKDGSGNTKLEDIGLVLKDKIVKVIKEEYGFTVNLKYLDPTYLIRSPPANAADTVMCAKLAQNAVHGAMAGFTAFSTGVVKNAASYIPIKTVNQAGVNKISIYDRIFQRLLGQIRQRPMVNPEFEEAAKQLIQKEEDEKVKRFEAIRARISQEDRERESRDRSIKL